MVGGGNEAATSVPQGARDEARVDQQVRNGGGGMPSFEGRLSDAEIRAVSRYLAEAASPNASGGGPGGGP